MDINYYRYLLCISGALNGVLLAFVVAFNFGISYNKHNVYSALMRKSMDACLHGTDYPEEWRTDRTQFNRRSPRFYCSDYKKWIEGDIIDFVNEKVR